MRKGRTVGAATAVVGSVFLAAAATLPASAHPTPALRGRMISGLRAGSLANATSTAFAGWEFQPKTAAKSVTAEFKIPKLTCKSTLSGIGPGAVMLTGTSSSPVENVAFVLLVCQSGSPAAEEELAVGGTPTAFTKAVAVGDVIKSTVATTGTKVTAKLQDLTKGHTFTITKSASGTASLAEAVIDDSLVNSSTQKQLPVANFGTIPFSAGAVGGKPLGSVTPNEAVNMETAKKVLQILTGPLTGTTKNAFLTTWKHS